MQELPDGRLGVTTFSWGERSLLEFVTSPDGESWSRPTVIASEAVNAAFGVTPDGTLLGKILIDEVVANLCFGGAKRNRLFICSTTSLRAIYVNARGAG